MKDYNKLTLRQLRVENKRLSRKIAYEVALARYQKREINSKPFELQIKAMQEVLDKRTGKAVKCSLPKKKQKELGILN